MSARQKEKEKRDLVKEIVELKGRMLAQPQKLSSRFGGLLAIALTLEKKWKHAKSKKIKTKLLLESCIVPVRLVAELQVFYPRILVLPHLGAA